MKKVFKFVSEFKSEFNSQNYSYLSTTFELLDGWIYVELNVGTYVWILYVISYRQN